MKRKFDDDHEQRMYEEGHPFYVNLAKLRSWSRDDLEVRLANSLYVIQEFVKSGRKSTIEFDRVCKQLDFSYAKLNKRIKANKDGASKRWADTNRIKREIKKEWTAWQDGKQDFANTSKFAEYVMDEYGFPAHASTVRRWDGIWRKERKSVLC